MSPPATQSSTSAAEGALSHELLSSVAVSHLSFRVAVSLKFSVVLPSLPSPLPSLVRAFQIAEDEAASSSFREGVLGLNLKGEGSGAAGGATKKDGGSFVRWRLHPKPMPCVSCTLSNAQVYSPVCPYPRTICVLAPRSPAMATSKGIRAESTPPLSRGDSVKWAWLGCSGGY